MSFFQAGSGKSMARLLMFILVLAVSASLLVVALKKGEINGPWSIVATGLATTLAGVWGVGKFTGKGKDAPEAKSTGTPDEAGDAK